MASGPEVAAVVRPEDVAERLNALWERIGDAARRAGRPASAVRLVAVTKGVPPPVMQAAFDAGATELGENRAQELLAKAPELARLSGETPNPGRPTWHFIGRLQRNKVAALAPLVDLWQSVDRIELGRAIAGRAPGAAVHAGWRGLAAGVLEAAAAEVRQRSSAPVRAVLGPCIHAECYEFSPSDLSAVVERLGPEVVGKTSAGRPALDVPRAIRVALAGVGVTDVTDVDVCTACSPGHFSHRRDGLTGLQAMLVAAG